MKLLKAIGTAAVIGLVLCASAMAKDIMAELSTKNANNPKCKVYFTVDVSHLTVHGQDFTMKWLDKDGAKKFASLCFTLDASKATKTFAVTASPLASSQQVGTRTETQTSNSTTQVDGTYSGDVNGTYTGSGNTTTTSQVNVPYAYTVRSQMIYGYVNGEQVGSVPWSFSDGTGLGGALVQKSAKNHRIHRLFEMMMEVMSR